jgi:hypothetical protein
MAVLDNGERHSMVAYSSTEAPVKGGGSAPVIGTLAQRRSGRGITGGRTATTSHRVDDAATAAELNNANHRLAAHGDNGVRCG